MTPEINILVIAYGTACVNYAFAKHERMTKRTVKKRRESAALAYRKLTKAIQKASTERETT